MAKKATKPIPWWKKLEYPKWIDTPKMDRETEQGWMILEGPFDREALNLTDDELSSSGDESDDGRKKEPWEVDADKMRKKISGWSPSPPSRLKVLSDRV